MLLHFDAREIFGQHVSGDGVSGEIFEGNVAFLDAFGHVRLSDEEMFCPFKVSSVLSYENCRFIVLKYRDWSTWRAAYLGEKELIPYCIRG